MSRPAKGSWWRIGALVIAMAATGIFVFFRTSTAPHEAALPSHPTLPTDALETPASAESESQAEQPTAFQPSGGSSPRAPRRRARASPPPSCPGDELDDPTELVRPSIWDLLRTRTDELRDRLPQLSLDASPELSEALSSLGALDDAGSTDLFLAVPDPDRDGFDVVVAALLHIAMRAFADGSLDSAREIAASAQARAPDDPLPHALAAFVAMRRRDTGRARTHLRAAFERADDEPSLALALARSESDHAEFEAARNALRVYLSAVPDDALTRRWNTRIEERAGLTRNMQRRTRRGVVVSFENAALGARTQTRVDALLETVDAVLVEVARLTHAARRQELAIVVYADRDALMRATCAPSWSGGVFDGVLHLDVALLGDESRWERSARHESTHAQLATLRGPIPTWFNEGFAQYMEGEPRPSTIAGWSRMVEQDYWIPFASLEGSLIVIDDPDDARLAYVQSLGMVRWLIASRGTEAFGHAFAELEAGRSTDLMSALVPDADGRGLLRFLASETR